ncbi:MAG: CoA transferase, partial [Armatimonadota bacterium]|nr:CoA transferase [Armatimonadota bacterium]
MTLPLEGVRVVEFAAYAAGPMVGKYLANFGATVVHVESRTRPDGLRTNYPPFKDNRPDPDAAG